MARPTLHHRLAADLRRRLEDPGWRPPAIGELAREWAVSYTTAARAVAALAAEGRIELARGRPPRRPDGEAGGRDLAAELRHDIAEGVLRIGDPLPTSAALCARLRCARRDLGAACRRLEDDDLLHRVGRGWRIGPRPCRRRGPMPLALLVGERAGFWRYQLTSAMAWFFTTCTAELEARGYRLAFAAVDDAPAIERQLAARGYRGAIVVGEAPEAELVGLLRRLQRRGAGAVLFDHAGRHAGLDPGARGLRCELDEAAVAALALDSLAARGHRRIGIALPDLGWCRRRCAALAAVAADRGLELLVHDATGETWWEHALATDPFGDAPGPGRPRRRCPAASALVERGASALIGLNDRLAYELYLALEAGGVAVPALCSVLGIDNHVQTVLLGISTIDTGFARLGYRAAHHLIGDLPRGGRLLRGRPQLVDRGSLARRA